MTIGFGPSFKCAELFLDKDELGRAARTHDCVGAIPTGLAPFEDIAKRMAIPLAQMLDHLSRTGAQRGDALLRDPNESAHKNLREATEQEKPVLRVVAET